MLELVTHRRAITAPVEEIEVDGQTYLRIPTVAAVEGVLNGELVLAEEIGRWPGAWEDVPVPVGHPQVDGLHVSARTADQVSRAPGRLYGVAMDGPALKGQIWLNVARAQALGGEAAQALAMLRAGQPVEVSTAYFRQLEQEPGEWDGVPYVGIQRNIVPDHLALLPGQVGACSWADGCGAPRVNEKAGGSMLGRMLVTMELSLDEQIRRIYTAWRRQVAAKEEPDNEFWAVVEVFSDRLIVDREGKLFGYPYTVNGDGSVSFGDPQEVERDYKPISRPPQTNTQGPPKPDQPNGGSDMDENELHTDCSECPEEPATNEAPPADVLADPEPAAASVPAVSPEMEALAEIVADFGGIDAFKQALLQFKTNADAERAGLIEGLAANKRNAFSRDDLEVMPTEQLRKLDISLRTDYSGRGLPITGNRSEWAPYVAPQ